MRFFLCYLVVVSLVSILVTCYDKYASKHRKKHRTPEASLFTLAIMGGALAMYLCMLIIRHKTKHKRFMLGLPLILLLQIALIIYLIESGLFGSFSL